MYYLWIMVSLTKKKDWDIYNADLETLKKKKKKKKYNLYNPLRSTGIQFAATYSFGHSRLSHSWWSWSLHSSYPGRRTLGIRPYLDPVEWEDCRASLECDLEALSSALWCIPDLSALVKLAGQCFIGPEPWHSLRCDCLWRHALWVGLWKWQG